MNDHALEPAADALCTALLRKSAESARTQQCFIEQQAPAIARCALAMAGAFAKGARLFTMGNGGSACDADHAAVEFMHPVIAKRPPLPALALGNPALLTAIGNDQDFAAAYALQLRTLARAGDIAIGISTSGKSANVNRGLQAAREIGMLTVGFSGRDGGKMPVACDFCFVVPSFSIHRIQEAQLVLLHTLWDLVHLSRGEEDVL